MSTPVLPGVEVSQANTAWSLMTQGQYEQAHVALCGLDRDGLRRVAWVVELMRTAIERADAAKCPAPADHDRQHRASETTWRRGPIEATDACPWCGGLL